MIPLIGNAQSTAVMEVKVNVIRGVQVEKTNSVNILSRSDKNKSDIIITSFPNSDVTITTDPHLVLKNDSGKELKVETDSLQKSDYSNGVHELSIDGVVPESIESKGSYRGSIKTVINYL